MNDAHNHHCIVIQVVHSHGQHFSILLSGSVLNPSLFQLGLLPFEVDLLLGCELKERRIELAAAPEDTKKLTIMMDELDPNG